MEKKVDTTAKTEIEKMQDKVLGRVKVGAVLTFVAIVLISFRSIDSVGWGIIFGGIGLAVVYFSARKIENFYLKMRTQYQGYIFLIGLGIAVTSLAIPNGDSALISTIGGALLVAITILIALAPSFYEKVGARLLT